MSWDLNAFVQTEKLIEKRRFHSLLCYFYISSINLYWKSQNKESEAHNTQCSLALRPVEFQPVTMERKGWMVMKSRTDLIASAVCGDERNNSSSRSVGNSDVTLGQQLVYNDHFNLYATIWKYRLQSLLSCTWLILFFPLPLWLAAI